MSCSTFVDAVGEHVLPQRGGLSAPTPLERVRRERIDACSLGGCDVKRQDGREMGPPQPSASRVIRTPHSLVWVGLQHGERGRC